MYYQFGPKTCLHRSPCTFILIHNQYGTKHTFVQFLVCFRIKVKVNSIKCNHNYHVLCVVVTEERGKNKTPFPLLARTHPRRLWSGLRGRSARAFRARSPRALRRSVLRVGAPREHSAQAFHEPSARTTIFFFFLFNISYLLFNRFQFLFFK